MKRIVALIVLVAAASAGGYLAMRRESPPVAVPPIATDHLHPMIVAAIDEAVARVRSEPQSAQNWGELGMVLQAHDLLEPARVCLQRAADLDPDQSAWPYLIGHSWEKADYAKALRFYQQALPLQPNYLPLRVRMARLLMRQGEFDESEAVLAEAYRLAPRDPFVLMTKGQLANLRNDSASAEEFYLEAAAQPGWSPQLAWQELTALAMRRGEHELAYQYRQKLDALPEIATAQMPDVIRERLRNYDGLEKNLAQQGDLALARGDLPAAIRSYEQFVDSRTDLPNAYFNLASAYALAGRFDDALRVYEVILDRFGSSVAAHMGLAQLYELRQENDAAINEYRRVLEIKPDHQRAQMLLGKLYEQAGKGEEAIDCYSEAVAIDPSSSQAQLALGVALMNKGRDAEARPHLQRAADLVPSDTLPKDFLRQLDERTPAG